MPGLQHTDLLIRQATAADVPQILALTRRAMQVYAEKSGIGTTLEALTEETSDILRHIRQNYVLVAENRDGIVGSVRLLIPGHADPAEPPDLAYFSRFAVQPALQQAGIGRLLYQACESYLISKGIRRIRLHTALSNPSLVEFYQARGFKLIHQDSLRGYPRGCFEKQIQSGYVPEIKA